MWKLRYVLLVREFPACLYKTCRWKQQLSVTVLPSPITGLSVCSEKMRHVHLCKSVTTEWSNALLKLIYFILFFFLLFRFGCVVAQNLMLSRVLMFLLQAFPAAPRCRWCWCCSTGAHPRGCRCRRAQTTAHSAQVSSGTFCWVSRRFSKAWVNFFFIIIIIIFTYYSTIIPIKIN